MTDRDGVVAGSERVGAAARREDLQILAAPGAQLGRDDAVDLSWLNAAFDQMNRIYGSFDRYVRDGLGLDQATIDALRAKLLV